MDSNVLGVIGGMGPEATQLFYKKIIEKTEAKKDQDHIDMVLVNHASMPDRTAAIAKGQVNKLIIEIEKDLRLLEQCQACCIAIPCNTAHVIIEELQKKTPIPIINMISETARYVASLLRPNSKIGILATDGTIKAGLYHKALEYNNLQAVTPVPSDQKNVMRIIYDGIKGKNMFNAKEFTSLGDSLMKAGCKCIILACTELSCIRNQIDLPDYYIDAMDVLAVRSIVSCNKNVKPLAYI